jgi:hypothetical protein
VEDVFLACRQQTVRQASTVVAVTLHILSAHTACKGEDCHPLNFAYAVMYLKITADTRPYASDI